MPRFICLFLISFTLLFCSSCQPQAADILLQAAATLEQDPDSALACLRRIENPERLRKAQRMDYYLLWVQASDKADRDITLDTLISEAQRYYLRKKQWDKATLAAFYCGRVFHERENYSRATQAYLDAESYAGHTDDNTLKGMTQHNLGGLYYQQSILGEAEKRFKAAFRYFKLADKPKYIANSASLLGVCLLAKRQQDSAFYYQRQALGIAEHHGDSTAMSISLHDFSITYQQMGNSAQAKAYALQALPLHTKKMQEIKAYTHLSSLYYDEHQLDSAFLYAQKAQQLLNEHKDLNKEIPVAIGVYDVLWKIDKEKGNCWEALHYHNLYTNQIIEFYTENEEKSIIGVREQYQYERVQNENNRLTIQRLWILLAALAGLLVLAIIALFYYRRSNRQKGELLQTKEQNKQLKDNKLELYKNTALIDALLPQPEKEKHAKLIKKMQQAVSGNKEGFTWEVFRASLNQLCDGFPDWLKQQFPQLDEVEYKICCFTRAGFSNQLIAELLQRSKSAIESRKITIRKKLGIEKGGDMNQFFASLTGKK